MGFLDLQCIARQDGPAGNHTIYGVSFGVYQNGTEQYLLLVKSNTSPKSIFDVTWTLEHAIKLDSLNYLGSRSHPKIICTVDETGSFTMMSFDNGNPSVSRYEPGKRINATYTEGGGWNNVAIAVGYRGKTKESCLFSVPRSSTSNNQSAVYHIFPESDTTIGFGNLNLTTRTMENLPTSWNLTSYSDFPLLKPTESRIYAYNDTVYAFGNPKPESSRLSILLTLPLNLTNDKAPPQPKSHTVNWEDEYYMGSCLSDISSTLGDHYFGLCDEWEHGAKSLGFSDGDDATVSNDSNNNDTEGDNAANGEGESQKQPEDDNDERRMLGKVENDEIGGSTNRGWGRMRHSREGESESIPMLTMVGRSFTSPSAPPLHDQGMSSSARVSTSGGTRQGRQLIVLSSHPRPNMFTTIEQSSNSEGEEEGEEEEESLAPPEEWIPKPFDPRDQTWLRPPQALPASLSTPSASQPSAPPATAAVTETSRYSVSGRTEDEDEPLPLYEDKLLDSV
ncbi:hypothetical protein DFQ27_003101 [Actinomortierella ambigua]|uniref:Uncharacterized protein n=1 Tax=Actinomortierella ambigua TaxID=1343610 RepID=A0A9P6U608_9FUNG|nr:hypothetical protein DFQ27_003101 [Actinomortierella ambigua]